jgi:hypothetical protein
VDLQIFVSLTKIYLPRLEAHLERVCWRREEEEGGKSVEGRGGRREEYRREGMREGREKEW